MMFPLLAPLITGGASLIGSIFNAQTTAQNSAEQMQNNLLMQQNSETFNAAQAQKTMDFQSQQAQIQRDYETQMSNTAFQRAQADMKAAGLNPILAASQGGASTPSVSAPSGATASVGTGSASTPTRMSPFAGLGSAVASAMDSAVKSKQIDLLTSEVAKQGAETLVAGAQKGYLESETGESMQRKAIKYPEEQRARALTEFQMAHPSITEASTVGPHLGEAIDKTISPVTDVIGSLYGGARQFMSGIGGSYTSKLGNVWSPATPPPSTTHSAISTLPSLRQRFKDAGGSDATWDQFTRELGGK